MVRELRVKVDVLKLENHRLFVGVRNCGADITLGDSFSAVRTGDTAIVDLRVEAILTYRRFLNIFNSGLTAELELSGTGMEFVVAESMLTGQAEQPMPDSVEILGSGEFHVETV